MGFWQRVGEWFGFRSSSAGAGGVEPRLARGTAMLTRDQAAMLSAFSSFPHLHTVVQARADAAAAAARGFQVFEIKRANTRADDLGIHYLRDAEERKAAIADLEAEGVLAPQKNSELLRLIRRPSNRMSGPDWWSLTSKHRDLVGEELWLKGARVDGRPTRLHCFVPTWLQRAPEPGDKDQRYKIVTPGSTIMAPDDDVIWTKKHDPANPYQGRGVGTAYVLRDELQLDELLAQMATGRAANKNYPDLLLALLGQPGRSGPGPGQNEVDVVTKLIEQKHSGVGRVGQAHVIAGDFKAQALGHTFVESQYMESRRYGRDTNMQTFRMPPELAGVLDNANRSTIGAAEDIFARTSTVVTMDHWTATLQDQVAPDFGDNLVVAYKSPVPADRDYEGGFFKSLPAAFRINEIRRRAGEPPVTGGDEFYKAPGAVPVAGSPSSPTEEPSKPKKKETA